MKINYSYFENFNDALYFSVIFKKFQIDSLFISLTSLEERKHYLHAHFHLDFENLLI